MQTSKSNTFLESSGGQRSHVYSWKSPTTVHSGQKCNSVWLVFIKNKIFSVGSSLTHSENSEFGRLSCFIQFFVLFNIVCDRYASDHVHFIFLTSIDHFHFHGFLKSKRMVIL